MGILLGVLTALTWGSSDFLARFGTHRMGTLRTMLYMQLFGFMLLVAAFEKPPDANDAEAVRRSGKGIGWALASAVGFGVLFWLLGIRVIPRVGALQTVWMTRTTCTPITAAVILL